MTLHKYSTGSVVKPEGFLSLQGSEFFHPGDTGLELSRVDIMASLDRLGAELSSVEAHQQGVHCPREQLRSYQAGLATLRTSWSAPGTGWDPPPC